MGRIVLLPEEVINKIAAGEVIVRPASCVKELIENSIDAKARNISIAIENAGKKLIEVRDDGVGMNETDAKLAFSRHATSKIRKPEDLNYINTFGFRGEALASITSVSRVELLTKEEDEELGTYLYIEGGKIKKEDKKNINRGTIIKVKDLFFNTPARLKFLKSNFTEETHIIDIVTAQGLANDTISFLLKIDKKDILFFPANASLKERIKILYGKEIYDSLIEISNFSDAIKVYGYITKPEVSKSTKNYQYIFVNKRIISNKMISYAVYEGYGTTLMKGKYPVIFLFIDIEPSLVDVNVHPAKAEVRFKKEKDVYNFVRNAVSEALKKSELIPDIKLERDITKNFKHTKDELNLKKSVEDAISSFFIKEEEKLLKDDYINFKNISTKDRVIKSEEKDLLNINILGQIHKTYIVGEDEQNLILIDQHAAHEKILYEKFMNEILSGKINIQNMLIPEIIEVNPSDKKIIENNIDIFKSVGFFLEEFGHNQYKIDSHPAIVKNKEIKAMIFDIIGFIKEKNKLEKQEILKEIIALISCRSAIKAGDELKIEEIENLVRELFELKDPFSCPHGRPPILKINFSEIEKMFKRKL